MKAQLDILFRIQQHMASPNVAAQAIQVQVKRIPTRFNKSNVEHRMCTQFSWKVERVRNPLLAMTLNGPMMRGHNFVLKTTVTRFVGLFLA